MVCFYCGKEMAEDRDRIVRWKGFVAPGGGQDVMLFHPRCLAAQIGKMREAISELRKAGWL